MPEPKTVVSPVGTATVKTPQDDKLAQQKPDQISGHIYKAHSAEPIARAIVSLKAENQARYLTKTDDTGAYHFSDLPPGDYDLQAERHGFITASYDDPGQDGEANSLTVKAGQQLSSVDLSLELEGVISGTVLDEDGEPVRGVPVSALHPFFQPGGQEILDQAQTELTDDLGNFRLSALESGSYYVHAGGDRQVGGRYRPEGVTYGDVYSGGPSLDEAQLIQVTPGSEAHVQLSLKAQLQTYTVSGVMVSDIAIEDMNIELLRTSGRSTSLIDKRSVGQPVLFPGGRYVISAVPPGEYILSGWTFVRGVQSGYRPYGAGSVSVSVTASDVKVNLVIESPGEVRGKVVTDAAGDQPERSTQVALLPVGRQDSGPTQMPIGAINQNGEFDLKNVPVGSYILEPAGAYSASQAVGTFSCTGVNYTYTPITVSAKSTFADCTVIFTKASSLRGHVLNGDRPVKGLAVVAIPERAELRTLMPYTLEASARTDARGEFAFRGILPGDYLLFAVSPDPQQTYFSLDFANQNCDYAQHVTIKPGDSATITLKPTRIP
jgi:hypothetical protein